MQKTIEELLTAKSLKDIMGGVVFDSVEATDETLLFKANDGLEVYFYHSQDCCEHVYIEEIAGDLQDLVGVPIVLAEERRSSDDPSGVYEATVPSDDLSHTWTFYTFRTIKGTVDVRWYGTSNGYYSETVNVSVAHPDYDPTMHNDFIFGMTRFEHS